MQHVRAMVTGIHIGETSELPIILSLHQGSSYLFCSQDLSTHWGYFVEGP